jgi:hypothetical protein
MASLLDVVRASVGGGGAIEHDRDQDRRQVADRRVRRNLPFSGTERRRGRGRRAYELDPQTENLLEPTDPESYLRVSVILSRISSEFDYVETDGAAGRRHVEAMIKEISDRAATSEDEDHRERLRHLTAAQPEAVHVRCGDNPTSESEFLSAMLVPGEPILFSYDSLAHEIAARPLLQRLARVLGYRIVRWEASLRHAH